jgi:nucleosome binding factor SPN SPT16 subunit
VGLCYPFVVQSGGGGGYDLRCSAGVADTPLVCEPVGVIVVQLGCRYKGYCANVRRTYLIDPLRAVSDAYVALHAAHTAGAGALREGARCAQVYGAAAAALAAAPGGGASLAPRLGESPGAALGLEFAEEALTLRRTCDALLVPGMVFNLATGLADVVDAAAKKGSPHRTFSLLLADTLAVTAGGAPPALLTAAKAALGDVSYEIKEQARAPTRSAYNVPRCEKRAHPPCCRALSCVRGSADRTACAGARRLAAVHHL